MKTKPIVYASRLLGFAGDVARLVRTHVMSSIRVQLILTFAVCLAASLLIVAIASPFMGKINRYAQIDYSSSMHEIDSIARYSAIQIMEELERRNSAVLQLIVPRPPGGLASDQELPGRPVVEPVSPGPGDIPPNTGAAEPPPAGGGASVEAPEPERSPEPQLPDEDSPSLERSAALIIQQILDRQARSYAKLLLLDEAGRVLLRSSNAMETQLDLYRIIQQAMDGRINRYGWENREFVSFYPLHYGELRAYLVVSGIPQPHIYYREERDTFTLALLGFMAFIALFFYMTKRKMKYIEELDGGLKEIAAGNLDYRIERRSRDELGELADNMNRMAGELQQSIEEERRAEQTKNELITNVSHDLRTPLTLVMGYLNLLRDKKYDNEEQAAQYLQIACGKSEKLKLLIDDLFTYTKLSNQGVRLNLKPVCLNELLEQLCEELVSVAEENRLVFQRQFPKEKLFAEIDAEQMIRVFENLLMNAVKYSMRPGVIRLRLLLEPEGGVKIGVINQSQQDIAPEELSRLFDRFYRLEQSRSSEGGGSGLGLAIAKSIVDLHRGDIWAESEDGEVRFWVLLRPA